MMITKRWLCAAAAGALAAALAACGTGVKPLMPTPVLYTEVGIDPLGHIPEQQHWTPRRVYYATTRARVDDLQRIDYGNRPDDQVSVGLALIGFGTPEMSWADLARVSTQAERDGVVPLSIAGLLEVGRFPTTATLGEAADPDATGLLLDDLNDAIADAPDKDLLIYVHGAKVNFYNGCVFAAQLDHFMGRDMTAMAFCWPTRQDIFAYAFGSDVDRAYDAADSLALVLELLAERTDARRIHVLSWSAGGRVAGSALASLRARYADVPAAELRERLRIGTAYFAAGDVPSDQFIEALPAIHDVADRVIVTASADDVALKNAVRFMGGATRIGQLGGRIDEEERAMLRSLERFEVVDVSHASGERGFDITGHEYWFDHPWASTDVLLAIRSDLAPRDRGLEQGEGPRHWFMPRDYPARLREVIGAAGREALRRP